MQLMRNMVKMKMNKKFAIVIPQGLPLILLILYFASSLFYSKPNLPKHLFLPKKSKSPFQLFLSPCDVSLSLSFSHSQTCFLFLSSFPAILLPKIQRPFFSVLKITSRSLPFLSFSLLFLEPPKENSGSLFSMLFPFLLGFFF